MVDTIQLREYENQRVVLCDSDARFVLRELSDKWAISREVDGSNYVINPNQFVGVITLPSGGRIESRPKIPIGNLFYMLAIAFQLPSPFRPEVATLDRLDELLEFVVGFFADLVEERIDKGLHRSYVDTEDNVHAVRGRICFAEDINRNYVLRHRTYCRFSEFTWDIFDNQIIRQVAHFLSGWGFRSVLRFRLSQIDAELSEVTLTNFPVSALDNVHYHRINEDYRQVHQLCRLFLMGASLSENSGAFNFRAFLIDMNKLFEEFVCQLLRDRTCVGAEIETQSLNYLDDGKKVPMYPDILVRREGIPCLVADCKYKRVAAEEFKNQDLYQLLSYCTATRVDRGLLIYPLHLIQHRDQIRVRNTPIDIEQTTIDLSGKPDQLVQSCNLLSEEVFARIGMHATLSK